MVKSCRWNIDEMPVCRSQHITSESRYAQGNIGVPGQYADKQIHACLRAPKSRFLVKSMARHNGKGWPSSQLVALVGLQCNDHSKLGTILKSSSFPGKG